MSPVPGWRKARPDASGPRLDGRSESRRAAHGRRASDNHDVARYIGGQDRTYIACPDDDPAQLDVDAACRSQKSGRVELFANGVKSREAWIEPAQGPVKARVVRTIPRPPLDTSLAAVASGQGVTPPYWALARPY
jgi:hypothetical protein